MTIGVIAAMGNGAAFPLFALIFGDMADAFGPNSTADDVVKKAAYQSMLFAIVGAGSFMCSFIMFSTWMTTG
jgi:ATP-binding cassette subfamily B (MDR/TAP) protein 1